MGRKPIGQEKIERLKELYAEGKKLTEIAYELNITKSCVSMYATKLGLVRQSWSDEELAILKANAHLPFRQIASLLNDSKKWWHVEYMIDRMDLRKGLTLARPRKFLNIRELEQFKKDYPNYTTKELAIKYDISITAIRTKARKFGLKKAYETNNPYTDEDIAFIKEWYGRIPATQIAAKLGRTEAQINSFIYRHGIKKNETEVRAEGVE
jgi:Zn-dependent peptidase ImmA (M78 family)